MTRARQLKIRGKPVAVDEVPGLYAVNRGAGPVERVDDPLALPALDVESVVASAPGMRRAPIEALQHAGWRFVRSPEQPRVDGPVARLFVFAGGRPALSTNRLIVGFKPAVADAEAARVLARHGGRVIEKLSFASGLYHIAVDPPPGEDVLDAAAALDAEDEVEFAEPEFIETLSGR